MKSKLIFLMCLFLTLSAGKMLASTSNTAEKDLPVITYSFNLGDVTDVSGETLEKTMDEFFSKISYHPDAKELTCSVTVSGEVNIGAFKGSVSVTVSGPCSEIAKEGKAIAQAVLKEVRDEMKKIF